MVSLLVGLAGGLFRNLHYLGLDDGGIALVKAALFAAGALWSLYLGWRLLAAQGIPGRWRWLPLLPGATGSLAVGAAWYPAIF